MKNLFLFLLVPTLSYCQSGVNNETQTSVNKTVVAQAADAFTISGNVQGLADGEVKITTTQGEQIIAKGLAKNGQFTIKGSLQEPGLYWLTMEKEQPQYLFLENASIRISGKKADIKNLQIEGSQSHKDFQYFRKTFDPLFANLNALTLQMQQAPENKINHPYFLFAKVRQYSR